MLFASQCKDTRIAKWTRGAGANLSGPPNSSACKPSTASPLFLFCVLVLLDAVLQELDRFLRAASAFDPELFPALLVVRDEELFELREQRLADIVDGFDVFVIVGVNGHAQQAVIRLFHP